MSLVTCLLSLLLTLNDFSWLGYFKKYGADVINVSWLWIIMVMCTWWSFFYVIPWNKKVYSISTILLCKCCFLNAMEGKLELIFVRANYCLLYSLAATQNITHIKMFNKYFTITYIKRSLTTCFVNSTLIDLYNIRGWKKTIKTTR